MKIQLTVLVLVRGAKRDVFLIMENGEMKPLFTITLIKNHFVLRHIKKSVLQDLIEMHGGSQTLQVYMTEIYRALLSASKNQNSIKVGRFLFTTQSMGERTEKYPLTTLEELTAV